MIKTTIDNNNNNNNNNKDNNKNNVCTSGWTITSKAKMNFFEFFLKENSAAFPKLHYFGF